MANLRIIFAGTTNFAAQHLYTLIKSTNKVVGVFTKLQHKDLNIKNRSFIREIIDKYNISMYTPNILTFEHEMIQSIINLSADIVIVVSYGIIFSNTVINLPKFGCINVHGSLLPRWRGAAPIQRAILAGDRQTGVTIIKMNTNIDAGEIIDQKSCDIQENDTTTSLSLKLAKIGSKILLKSLTKIFNTNSIFIKKTQNLNLVTYAKKINKKEAKINWYLPAIFLQRCIRAYNPWPVSYFTINKQVIKIWLAQVNISNTILKYYPGTILAVTPNGIHIATGENILVILILQPACKKIMLVKDFLNSRNQQFKPGIILK